jgi:hypothetical protein
LAPVFWEHEVLNATDTFQSQIPRAGKADLCVFILWSWFELGIFRGSEVVMLQVERLPHDLDLVPMRRPRRDGK